MNNELVKFPNNLKFTLLNCIIVTFLVLLNFSPKNFLNINLLDFLIILSVAYQFFLLFSTYIFKKLKFNQITTTLLFFIEFSFLFILSLEFKNSQSIILIYSIPWVKWIIISPKKYHILITFFVILALISYQTKFLYLPSLFNMFSWIFISLGLNFISNFLNNLKEENKKYSEYINNLKLDLAISKRVIEGLKSISYSTKWESTIKNFSKNLKNIGGFNSSIVFLRQQGTENLKLEIKDGININSNPINIKDHPEWEKLRQGNSVLIDPNNQILPPWINENNQYGIVIPLINELNFFGLVYGFFESKDHVQEKFLEESKVFCYVSSKYLWLVKNTNKQNSLDIILSDAGRKLEENSQLINLKDLSLDLDNKSIKFKEKNVPISSQEFTVMKMLAKNINSYIEDFEIEENAKKENLEIVKSSIPITIYRLRKKLAKIPGGSKLIKSKRGKGYSLSIN